MKMKLFTYSAALMIGLSAFLYAKPDLSKLNPYLTGTTPAKQYAAVMVKNQGTPKAQINKSHHFKNRILNSTRPVQRCLKNLKI
jgi:hypothetical protein